MEHCIGIAEVTGSNPAEAWIFFRLLFRNCLKIAYRPRGSFVAWLLVVGLEEVLDLSLGRGVLPGPWSPDPVYDKKFVKILKNQYPVYDFQVKFHSLFRKYAWFLDPVYKKSSKIFQFETLFMSGRSKNHTLKGGTPPYSLNMGVPPGGDGGIKWQVFDESRDVRR